MDNPRATVHQLWESFVPPILGLGTVILIIRDIVFPDITTRLVSAVAGAQWLQVDTRTWDNLKDLEILKLTPVFVLFGIVLLLYLFDRVSMAVGHALPPYLGWTGVLASRLDVGDIYQLWQHLPEGSSLADVQAVAEREAESVKAEDKGKTLGFLEYRERQFSSAVNLFAYCKFLLLCAVVCFLIATRREVSMRQAALQSVAWTVILCAVGFIGAVRATYLLIDVKREQIRIAAERLRWRGDAKPVADRTFEILEREIAEQRKKRALRFQWLKLSTLRRVGASMS